MIEHHHPINRLLLPDSFKVTLAQLHLEPHRFCHNMQHLYRLQALLSEYEDYRRYDKLLNAVVCFHDAVYYPQSKLNEYLSMSLFTSVASVMKFTQAETLQIVDVIIATIAHTHPDNARLPMWGKLFLDMDIYDLGDSTRYEENRQKIMREFATCFSLQGVYAGRRQWLSHMLTVDRIYWLHPQRDEAARDNIHREYASMHNISAWEADNETFWSK